MINREEIDWHCREKTQRESSSQIMNQPVKQFRKTWALECQMGNGQKPVKGQIREGDLSHLGIQMYSIFLMFIVQ